jgi:hypothetical protein
MRAMTIPTLLLAGAMIAGAGGMALAQSASTVGSGGASGGSGTIGSGGSAAAGGTSASTLGLGAKSGDSATIGTGGSAAAEGGKTHGQSKVHGNGNNLMGQSKEMAHEQGGVWSKSHTKTKLHKGTMSSRTKSMAHEPGGPPAKSTTGESVDLDR